jgi:hypothetical protein
MLAIRITGDQIRAGRSLANLSQEKLAVRSGLCRQTIRAYEISSNAVPDATVSALGRVVATLESAGVRFHGDGAVSLQRASQHATAAPAPVQIMGAR